MRVSSTRNKLDGLRILSSEIANPSPLEGAKPDPTRFFEGKSHAILTGMAVRWASASRGRTVRSRPWSE